MKEDYLKFRAWQGQLCPNQTENGKDFLPGRCLLNVTFLASLLFILRRILSISLRYCCEENSSSQSSPSPSPWWSSLQSSQTLPYIWSGSRTNWSLDILEGGKVLIKSLIFRTFRTICFEAVIEKMKNNHRYMIFKNLPCIRITIWHL